MELVKVEKTMIGREMVNSVDARELHEFLESKQQFSHWIKNRIERYSFTQGIDFITIDNSIYSPPRKEYIITIDTAKELSMVEQNEKGREARKYFIECEKIAKGLYAPRKNIVSDLKANLEAAKIFGLKGNMALLSANNMTIRQHSVDLLEESGAKLEAVNQVQYLTPTILGKQIGVSASVFNRKLESAGFQKETRDHKNKLVWVVTNKGKEHCQLIDVNKRYAKGSPVLQIKWAANVIDMI